VLRPAIRIAPLERGAAQWRSFCSSLPVDTTGGAARREADLVLTARYIPENLRGAEASIMARKWPGYRFIGPWAATQLYAEKYRIHFSSNFGFGPSGFGALPGDPSFVALWKMRQAADRQGMEYGSLLRIAFSMNRRKSAPFDAPHARFNNLGRNKNFGRKVWKQRAELRDRLLYADVGIQYRIPSFAGLPAQTEYRRLLIETAAKWNFQEILFWDRLVARPCLPGTAFKGQFDLRTSTRLKAEAEKKLRDKTIVPEQFAGVVEHQLWQACFGLPGAYSETCESCSRCPAAKDCVFLATKIVDVVGSPAAPEAFRPRRVRISS
jgi:hypothetical protein